MNWKIITAIVLVAVVGSVLGVLYYVAGTPQYSLYRLRQAVQEGDRENFYRYFDEEKVIARAIENAVGGVPAGPAKVSRKATQLLIPASEKLIRSRIDERLADPESIPLKRMDIDSIRYANAAAFVTLRDPSDGSTTVLTLEQMPDRHWKVVEIDLAKANIEYSLDEARTRMEELLPPSMPEVQRPNLGDVPALPRSAPGPGGR